MNDLDLDSVLITAVSLHLDGAELHSRKLFIFATPTLLITMERETMIPKNFDSNLAKDMVFLEVQTDLPNVAEPLTVSHTSTQSTDLRVFQTSPHG